VKDHSGAAQTDTGLKRTLSDPDGSYVIPNLPVGLYRPDAMLQGFRTFSRTGLVLSSGHNNLNDLHYEDGNCGPAHRARRWRSVKTEQREAL